jgi:hypothetical protein
MKKYIITVNGSHLIFFSLAPKSLSVRAEVIDYVSSFLYWRGMNLSSTSSISQSFTLLSDPSPGEGEVDWSLDIGNSTSTLTPSIVLKSI